MAPMRQSPASKPTSVQVCRIDGMIPASAVHSNRTNRMLKKPASLSCSFGLSGLFGLFGLSCVVGWKKLPR